jgi:hypothetical protein
MLNALLVSAVLTGLALKYVFMMLIALLESFAKKQRMAEETEYVYPDVGEIPIVLSDRSARSGGVRMDATLTMIAPRTQLASMALGKYTFTFLKGSRAVTDQTKLFK